MSIAFSIKIVAIFDFLTLLFMGFVFNFWQLEIHRADRKLKWVQIKGDHIKELAIYSVSFLILPFFTMIFFAARGAFWDYFSAVYTTNIGYVNVNNNLYLPLGLIGIKLVLLLFFLFVIFIFRKRFSYVELFIYVWLAFSLFSAFFSEREYTHYLLVMLPAISYFVGLLLFKTKRAFVQTVVLLIILLVIVKNFIIYTDIVGYYSNYINYVFGSESTYSYRSFFDSTTPQDYEIARIIDSITAPNDKIFVWSDRAQIYALSKKLPPEKFITAYHILFYKGALKTTKKTFEKTNIKYIILTEDAGELGEILSKYKIQYKVGDALIYEKQV